ncbi:MAG: prolyl oligopeptidase family serine peptidase [Phycisphaerales bacterium]|nr:MAG: prolyl oligopeptidase family serine peptidase [Phycisphaerales bacterium]
MSQSLPLTIEVNGGSLPGTLHAPEGDTPPEGRPAVLLCDDPLADGEATAGLPDEIARVLCEAGLMVAGLDRAGAAADNRRPEDLEAGTLVDQASALFRAIALREEVDIDRIGALGYSLGAIVAQCLIQRTKHIARLCLLSPRSAGSLTAEFTRNNGAGESGRPAEPTPRLIESLPALSAESGRPCGSPMLILHGAADRIVPPEQTLVYLESSGRAGPRPEHMLVAQGDHAFTSPEARAACLVQIVRFFQPLLNAAGSPK